MKQLLNTAITAALEASKAILEIYHSGDFDVEIKGDNSPLSKADTASHNIIMSFLTKTNIPVLSEEGNKYRYKERKSWKSFWMIDPIDGTKEFINRNGDFTVNIALIKGNKPVLGVVCAPLSNELYYAEQGYGAFKIENSMNIPNLENAPRIDLRNGYQRLPNIFTLLVSKSHITKNTINYINKIKANREKVETKSFGSSLKICKVAEGYAHCYPRFGPTMEWDTAAAHAVAIYSGCRVINAETTETLLYNKESLLNPFFIVNREEY